MKRIPELRDLSEDHHHALVLALKARKAATGVEGFSVSDVWAEVKAKFSSELEPHFRIEESLIAKILEIRGERQLTQRLLDEHATLREFVIPGHSQTQDELGHFAELLEKHIRFEERELFEVAQDKMNPNELSEVAKACLARKSRK